MLIYLASPYTQGDTNTNVRVQCQLAESVRRCGHYAFAPVVHSHARHFLKPQTWDYWIEECLEFVARCDYLIRWGGPSKGGDLELERACSLGIGAVRAPTEWAEPTVERVHLLLAGGVTGASYSAPKPRGLAAERARVLGDAPAGEADAWVRARLVRGQPADVGELRRALSKVPPRVRERCRQQLIETASAFERAAGQV